MSVDRRLLNWGIFLVLLGGVPLAVAQGWIPREAVARAWELWPLILIGAGIGLILRRTPFRALGGIIVAGTCGVILGSLLAVGFGGLSVANVGCGSAGAGAPQVLSEQGVFAGGTGRVVLEANCATLQVATGSGAAWAVAVTGSTNATPTVEQADDQVVVRSPKTPAVFPFGAQRSTWQVDLGTDPRLDLDVHLNAGGATIDLGAASLSRLSFEGNAVGDSSLDLSHAAIDLLDVRVNAASVAVRLPETANLTGAIEGNAAAVSMCAATGVGLRLLVEENITSSNNYAEAGLVRQGNAWETPDYAAAATHVELRTRGSAASFKLNPREGCR